MRHDEKNPDLPRQRYDDELDVKSWRTPGGAIVRRSDIPDNAPVWWHGDEEASQGFFTAMRVVTDG